MFLGSPRDESAEPAHGGFRQQLPDINKEFKSNGQESKFIKPKEPPKPKPPSKCIFKAIECAICKEPDTAKPQAWSTLSGCKHSFHSDCIQIWLKSRRKCPICRADVSEEDRQIILNGVEANVEASKWSSDLDPIVFTTTTTTTT